MDMASSPILTSRVELDGALRCGVRYDSIYIRQCEAFWQTIFPGVILSHTPKERTQGEDFSFGKNAA